MAAQSKTQLLNEIYTQLKKRYKLQPREDRMTVLEAIVYAICHEGTTREQANQALSRFKDGFYDWNEVRVSSLEEIQGVLAGLPDPEERAYKIRRFLRQLFEKTYGFALDGLGKKPLKEAAKQLQEYEALQSDYVLATVIQQALGGHAIPVDAPMRRALERLAVADPSIKDEALRALLERAVPKNRGAEFVDLMEELAHDTCIEGPPDCPRCELKKLCHTGQARLVQLKAGEKAAAKAEKHAAKVEKTTVKTTAKTAGPTKGKKDAAKEVAKLAAAKPAPKTVAKVANPSSSKTAPSKPAPSKPASSKAAKPKKPAPPKAKTKPTQPPAARKAKAAVDKRKSPRSK